MSTLPNPWNFSSAASDAAADTAVASCPSPQASGATATPSRFVLDERAFMEAIEPLPIFLHGKPLGADDLMPVLSLLAGY